MDTDLTTTPTSTEEPTPSASEAGAVDAKDGAGDQKEGQEHKVEAKVRTYSVEEWDKRQSALDSQAAKVKREYDEQLTSLSQEQERLREQIDQGRFSSFLKTVEESGGNLDLARGLVAKEQELSKKDLDYRKRETELKRLQTELDGTAKAIAARDLVEKYELPKEKLDELLKSKDPIEMKTLALELALAKTKQAAVPVTKTAKPGDSTKGADLSKMTVEQRLNWVLEHRK